MLPPRGVSSAAATYWGVGLGALVLTPLALGLFAADGVPEAGPAAWGAVLVLAAVTSIAGYVGWYWALSRGGIQRIATLQFLQPLSGFVLAVLVLGEGVGPGTAIGAAAVIGGVVIAQRA
jgi:drug/metabolite transporter (DMT)-like permease